MRVTMVLVAVSMVLGCDRPAPTGPDGAFRQFSDALRKQDTTTAFSLLSQRSQARLSEATKAVSESTKGLVKNEPALMLLTPTRAQPLVSLTVSSNDGTRAELVVTTCARPLEAGGTCPTGADVQERVTMSKEPQRWAVELPELVKP